MPLHRIVLAFGATILSVFVAACAHSPTPASSSTPQNPATGPTVIVPAAQGGPQVIALPPTGPIADDGSLLQVSSANPSQGSMLAPLTVVAFVNQQCRHSATVMHTIDELRARYPLNVMRVVWKNYPIASMHRDSQSAAQAGMAVYATAGADPFFCFSRSLFANRNTLGPDLYRQAASQCGASATAMDAEIASRRPAARVEADLDLARALQVIGTPTLFINGIRVEGAEEVDKLTSIFDAEQLAARKSLASGTPVSRLHAERARSNFQLTEEDSAGPEPIDTKIYKVPIGSSPVLGQAAAPITIVIFSDFQCPFCKIGAASMVDVKKEYGVKVRFAFKHLPLVMHPRAEPSSEFAVEARAQQGDAGFWRAHDAIFASAPRLDDADLDLIANALHLNQAATRSAVLSHKHQNAIEADGRLAELLGVTGTPAFFVNGRRVNGAMPVEYFHALIEEIMPTVEALKQQGIPPARIYDEIIKNGVVATALKRP